MDVRVDANEAWSPADAVARIQELEPFGLSVVEEILTDIEGISFVHLGGKDVVRHQIVQEIVEAYGRYGQQPLTAGD